jgi:pyrroline-5-carboxylate reductase
MKNMIMCVIGVGKIGEAIIRGLLQNFPKESIIACDKKEERRDRIKNLGIVVFDDNRKSVEKADIIILCVKPKDVGEVLEDIRLEIRRKILISMAAAVPLEFLKATIPSAKVVRAMPNIAVMVLESFTAYCVADDVSIRDREIIEEILGSIGKYAEVKEKHMNAITGLSGGGPAYISIIIEALMMAGMEVGLSQNLSFISSAQTVLGTSKLILEAGKELTEIKEMVATPGGTTIEGIKEFKKVNIRALFKNAVEAATRKSMEISKSF